MKYSAKQISGLYLSIGLGFLSILFTSCSSDFDKIPKTGFIDKCEKNTNSLVPFDALVGYDHPKEWNDRINGVNGKKQYVYLAPVDISHVDADTLKHVNQENLKKLGDYFNERLAFYMNQAAKKNPNFVVLNKKNKQTAVMQVAIISVAPTKTSAGIAKTVLGFVKLGFLVKPALSKGHIVMAGRVTDRNGKMYMEFADYEKDHSSVLGIDAKDYEHYAHHRTNIDQWAKNIADVFSTPYEHKTSRKLVYVTPW